MRNKENIQQLLLPNIRKINYSYKGTHIESKPKDNGPNEALDLSIASQKYPDGSNSNPSNQKYSLSPLKYINSRKQSLPFRHHTSSLLNKNSQWYCHLSFKRFEQIALTAKNLNNHNIKKRTIKPNLNTTKASKTQVSFYGRNNNIASVGQNQKKKQENKKSVICLPETYKIVESGEQKAASKTGDDKCYLESLKDIYLKQQRHEVIMKDSLRLLEFHTHVDVLPNNSLLNPLKQENTNENTNANQRLNNAKDKQITIDELDQEENTKGKIQNNGNQIKLDFNEEKKMIVCQKLCSLKVKTQEHQACLQQHQEVIQKLQEEQSRYFEENQEIIKQLSKPKTQASATFITTPPSVQNGANKALQSIEANLHDTCIQLEMLCCQQKNCLEHSKCCRNRILHMCFKLEHSCKELETSCKKLKSSCIEDSKDKETYKAFITSIKKLESSCRQLQLACCQLKGACERHGCSDEELSTSCHSHQVTCEKIRNQLKAKLKVVLAEKDFKDDNICEFQDDLELNSKQNEYIDVEYENEQKKNNLERMDQMDYQKTNHESKNRDLYNNQTKRDTELTTKMTESMDVYEHLKQNSSGYQQLRNNLGIQDQESNESIRDKSITKIKHSNTHDHDEKIEQKRLLFKTKDTKKDTLKRDTYERKGRINESNELENVSINSENIITKSSRNSASYRNPNKDESPSQKPFKNITKRESECLKATQFDELPGTLDNKCLEIPMDVGMENEICGSCSSFVDVCNLCHKLQLQQNQLCEKISKIENKARGQKQIKKQSQIVPFLPYCRSNVTTNSGPEIHEEELKQSNCCDELLNEIKKKTTLNQEKFDFHKIEEIQINKQTNPTVKNEPMNRELCPGNVVCLDCPETFDCDKNCVFLENFNDFNEKEITLIKRISERVSPEKEEITDSKKLPKQNSLLLCDTVLNELSKEELTAKSLKNNKLSEDNCKNTMAVENTDFELNEKLPVSCGTLINMCSICMMLQQQQLHLCQKLNIMEKKLIEPNYRSAPKNVPNLSRKKQSLPKTINKTRELLPINKNIKNLNQNYHSEDKQNEMFFLTNKNDRSKDECLTTSHCLFPPRQVVSLLKTQNKPKNIFQKSNWLKKSDVTKGKINQSSQQNNSYLTNKDKLYQHADKQSTQHFYQSKNHGFIEKDDCSYYFDNNTTLNSRNCCSNNVNNNNNNIKMDNQEEKPKKVKKYLLKYPLKHLKAKISRKKYSGHSTNFRSVHPSFSQELYHIQLQQRQISALLASLQKQLQDGGFINEGYLCKEEFNNKRNKFKDDVQQNSNQGSEETELKNNFKQISNFSEKASMPSDSIQKPSTEHGNKPNPTTTILDQVKIDKPFTNRNFIKRKNKNNFQKSEIDSKSINTNLHNPYHSINHKYCVINQQNFESQTSSDKRNSHKLRHSFENTDMVVTKLEKLTDGEKIKFDKNGKSTIREQSSQNVLPKLQKKVSMPVKPIKPAKQNNPVEKLKNMPQIPEDLPTDSNIDFQGLEKKYFQNKPCMQKCMDNYQVKQSQKYIENQHKKGSIPLEKTIKTLSRDFRMNCHNMAKNKYPPNISPLQLVKNESQSILETSFHVDSFPENQKQFDSKLPISLNETQQAQPCDCSQKAENNPVLLSGMKKQLEYLNELQKCLSCKDILTCQGLIEQICALTREQCKPENNSHLESKKNNLGDKKNSSRVNFSDFTKEENVIKTTLSNLAEKKVVLILEKLKTFGNNTMIGLDIHGPILYAVNAFKPSLNSYGTGSLIDYGQMEVPQLIQPWDLVIIGKYLFLTDCHIYNTIHRIDLKSKCLMNWRMVTNGVRKMSKTKEGNLLVTKYPDKLVEYTTEGQVFNEITVKVEGLELSHAIKINNNNFVVCGSNWIHPSKRICLVNCNGHVKTTYKQKLRKWIHPTSSIPFQDVRTHHIVKPRNQVKQNDNKSDNNNRNNFNNFENQHNLKSNFFNVCSHNSEYMDVSEISQQHGGRNNENVRKTNENNSAYIEQTNNRTTNLLSNSNASNDRSTKKNKSSSTQKTSNNKLKRKDVHSSEETYSSSNSASQSSSEVFSNDDEVCLECKIIIEPVYMILDKNNNILVCDYSNNSIALIDIHLNFIRVLVGTGYISDNSGLKCCDEEIAEEKAEANLVQETESFSSFNLPNEVPTSRLDPSSENAGVTYVENRSDESNSVTYGNKSNIYNNNNQFNINDLNQENPKFRECFCNSNVYQVSKAHSNNNLIYTNNNSTCKDHSLLKYSTNNENRVGNCPCMSESPFQDKRCKNLQKPPLCNNKKDFIDDICHQQCIFVPTENYFLRYANANSQPTVPVLERPYRMCLDEENRRLYVCSSSFYSGNQILMYVY